jgi:hypothetical protein
MRKTNEQSLKDVLHQLVDAYKLRSKLNQTKIRSVWAEKMGTTINEYTREIKVIRRKLFITLDSASLRQELGYSRDKIKEMMNEEIGEEYIEEVVIR